jgi:hypothetical protein
LVEHAATNPLSPKAKKIRQIDERKIPNSTPPPATIIETATLGQKRVLWTEDARRLVNLLAAW